MKSIIVESPEKAIQGNAQQIRSIALRYGSASLLQRNSCRHKDADTCDDCLRSSDNLFYFSVALGVVAGAVSEGKADELLHLLTKFAVENLEGFPKGLAEKGLYHSETDFPDIIER